VIVGFSDGQPLRGHQRGILWIIHTLMSHRHRRFCGGPFHQAVLKVKRIGEQGSGATTLVSADRWFPEQEAERLGTFKHPMLCLQSDQP